MERDKKISILRVAGKSSVKAVAGSITKSFEDKKEVEIHVIGASAISQAIKSCAMARGFLATKGYDLVVSPGFSSTIIDGEEKTTIRLVLKLL